MPRLSPGQPRPSASRRSTRSGPRSQAASWDRPCRQASLLSLARQRTDRSVRKQHSSHENRRDPCHRAPKTTSCHVVRPRRTCNLSLSGSDSRHDADPPRRQADFTPWPRVATRRLMERHARLSTGCPPQTLRASPPISLAQAKDQVRDLDRQFDTGAIPLTHALQCVDHTCPIWVDSKVDRSRKPQVRVLTWGFPWSRLRDSNPRPTHYECVALAN